MKIKDYRRDPRLSLSEKLKMSWSERIAKKIELPKCPKLPLPSQVTLNRGSQTCLVFALFAVSGWGVTIGIPFMYESTPNLKYIHQSLGCFLLFQMLINLLCIRYVDTSYHPRKYGGLPENLEIGRNISRTTDANARFDSKNGTADGQGARGVNASSSTVAVERKIPTSNESLFYVATGFPEKGSDHPKRTSFPYWSWVPCLLCNRPRPPRCHHCPLCNRCVLKRDHHCFFAGACVGYQNLRHFVVFLFWATASIVFSLFHGLPYIYTVLLPEMHFIDFFTPVGLVRAALGYVAFHSVFVTLLAWLCIFFLYAATYQLRDMYILITSGLTCFERDFKMKVYNTMDMSGKLKSVFGQYWLLNFLLPLHFIYPPIDDPIHWPDMRCY